MAKKIIFISNVFESFREETISYDFIPGFAPIQRQKNVANLHDSIKRKYPAFNILEVSTKSNNPLGVSLSAFNLKLDGLYIESIFQSSKCFNDGSHYEFLITQKPSYAKKFIREKAKSSLQKFLYDGVEYPLKPPSFFYDYIYIKALYQNKKLSDKLIDYDVFTDIEFNHNKSINCQARACAIYAYLLRNNLVEEVIKKPLILKQVYKAKEVKGQLSLFDF